ncbi:hypothetical protein V7O66_00785 [Methanolobus sp. ZRKC3]|uniref:hypothetical protein n=1 Tax=Methanolobus sp. ZRKC3 TaxID=3125786 RepID=UPI00324ED0BD
MKSKLIITILLILSIVALSGCTDISDSYKPGSFGTTEEEMQIVDAVTDKYGDMTAKGTPRLLEVMMTSSTENFIPVDKVLKYSKDSAELYAWFIYDNFEYDMINVEWIYLDNDYSIYTFESETGEDFGRGTFILEKPDDGWPLGDYEVIISGAGVEESVEFEIIDGTTVSIPLELLDGAAIGSQKAEFENMETSEQSTTTTSSGIVPGWYLTTVEDYGDKPEKTHEYYTYDVDYERGNVFTSDVGNDGETAQVRTISEEPEDFYAAEEEISINVRKESVFMETDGLGLGDSSTITIDAADIPIDRGTASGYYLEDETYGAFFNMQWDDPTGTVKEGTFKADAPWANAFGGSFRIRYAYQNGASYRTNYIYEWRE